MLDNIMISIISTIMITLGFINGYVIAYGLSLEKQINLNKKLQKAIDNQFDSDKQIDYLKAEYNSLLEKYNEYDELINKINNQLSDVPLHLPPRDIDFPPLPVSPLVRCDYPCHSDDDSSASTPETPSVLLDSTD